MSTSINATLLEVFHAIEKRPADELPSPPACQKRASVALIIAFFPISQPTCGRSKRFDDIAELKRHVDQSADSPHVLFIRRAARSSDRWSSHIALPGGRREADESDLDAAIRETQEEVDLNISPDLAFCGGSLGQRLVTSRLGTVQLLTLCPYLFLLKDVGQAPVLTGQASEVHGCHWVPLAHLLDSKNATKEYVDVSSRLVGGERSAHPQVSKVLRKVVRLATGLLAFSGTSLKPSLSIYSTPDNSARATGHVLEEKAIVDETHARGGQKQRKETRMILWGLTQAVMLDFLDFFPDSKVRECWHYPTFTSPDLALVLYLLNTRHRQNLAGQKHNYVAIANPHAPVSSLDWVGKAMEGYYSTMRRGIVITILLRFTFLAWLTRTIIYRSRTSR